jgi:carboxypeptidase C (cathepsin A)
VRAFDALPWKEQARYKAQEFKPWYFKDASGRSKLVGLSKGVEKLLFVSADHAGHEVPGPTGQPEASLDLLNRWMRKERPLAN